MGRHRGSKGSGKGKGQPPRLIVDYALLHSKEFLSLTPATRWVLIELLMQASYQTKDGPARVGMKCRVPYSILQRNTAFTSTTISRALKELIKCEYVGKVEKYGDERDSFTLRQGNFDTVGEYKIIALPK